MGTRLRVVCWALVAVLVGAAGWAQEKKAGAAAGSPSPHIEVVQAFLLAWGRGKSDEAKAVAAEKVTVKLGDKEVALDLAGGKAAVGLVLPFKGLSTVREGGKVKRITVEQLHLKAGDVDKQGKGMVTIEEKEGKFLVTGVSVE